MAIAREALTIGQESLGDWDVPRSEYERRLAEMAEAKNVLEHATIVVAQLSNDLEAEQDLFAIRDEIRECRTTVCAADDFLTTERFETFQPHVLRTVGVHHAYAKGLTGGGVRIAIEDDIVNFALPEFAGRVSFDGAVLTHPVADGDDYFSDARRCDRAGESMRESPGCKVFSYNSRYRLLETLTVKAAVESNGWPDKGERWFVRNDRYEEGSLARWSEIPDAAGEDRHGTAVASVAAGRDFGIAPGATIVPVARTFAPDGEGAGHDVSLAILDEVSQMPLSERALADAALARAITVDYAHYDIINRSFGSGLFDSAGIQQDLDDATPWWGDRLRQLLPRTWGAFTQTGRHPDDRAVVVYAAGNERQDSPGPEASLPFHEPRARGHHLAVMAVDRNGSHAAYTNFCGALPPDWDVERWGRHFCLAAPGTVNAAGNVGSGHVFHEIAGTSFAAPVVSGAIALLMEHFRGQLGNSEIVKRVVDTADNTGRYAQLEIYGAGLLDIEAALQPVGRTTTGTPSASAAAAQTTASVPSAMGRLGRRLAAQGVEVASLDGLGAPFWSSPEAYIRPKNGPVSPIPDFSAPEDEGGQHLHLGFSPGTVAGPADDRGMRLLAGASRIGLERAPAEGLRWGILGDAATWQGAGVSGAFGDKVRSMTAWVGRDTRFELDDAWTLRASGTLALGQVFHEPGTMLSIDPHLLSTWDIGLERGERGHGTWSRIKLSQPLRAESGDATLNYLAGLKDGAPSYDSVSVSLVPEGRELELSVAHEAPIGPGRGAIEVARRWDAGHEPGATGWRIGLAYRLRW